ncbi:MAG: hypothetical protein JW763_08820 [candidate division Zixibacteria bacterium]|nr:hypothetical protein [candidate division Zixibacteria bacterium]
MFPLKKSYLIPCIIFVCIGIPLQAQTDTICDFCGASIPAYQPYCDQCGNWMVSGNNEIDFAFSTTIGYNRAKMNAVSTFNLGQLQLVADWERTEDTLAAVATYRFYLKPRYQHPNVPFAFIPYNYRNNIVDIAGAFINDDYTLIDKGDLPFHSELGFKAKVLGINTLYYFNRIFVGGGLRYMRQTRDDLESDDWCNRTVILSGSFGFYNPQNRTGITIQFHDLSYDRSRGDEDMQFIRLSPFIEYLPTPEILLGANLDYYFESGESDYFETKFPIWAKYIMTEYWWEFIASLSYYNDYEDIHEYDFQVSARKYIHDISVHVMYGYFRRTIDAMSGGFEYIKTQTGADIALYDRTILLDVSGFYHIGERDSIGHFYNYTNLGVSAGLQVFFR